MLEAQLVKRNNPEDHAALRSSLLGASVTKIPGRNDSSEQGLVLAHG